MARNEKVNREASYAQPMRFYRDPLEGLMDREARTCAGCGHESTTLGRTFCLLERKHGARCKQYIEGA